MIPDREQLADLSATDNRSERAFVFVLAVDRLSVLRPQVRTESTKGTFYFTVNVECPLFLYPLFLFLESQILHLLTSARIMFLTHSWHFRHFIVTLTHAIDVPFMSLSFASFCSSSTACMNSVL